MKNPVVISAYRDLRALFKAFAEGHLPFVVLLATPGLGKSFNLEKMLRRKGCLFLGGGSMSTYGTYCAIAQHKDKPIILDDAVRSDPVFNERIGANFRITLGATPGQNPREAANDLTKVLKSGSLPARLQKEFEIRVGADLGEDSVKAGFWAFVYGLSAVVLFMLVYYRGSGIIAVFALAFSHR